MKRSEVVDIYGEDILAAEEMLEGKPSLASFVATMALRTNRINHSDMWSEVYDYVEENYPNDDINVTGLTYLIELRGNKYVD